MVAWDHDLTQPKFVTFGEAEPSGGHSLRRIRSMCVNARDDDGDTPLHRAAGLEDDPSFFQDLLEAGADIDARNDDGTPPLGTAPWSDAPEALTDLMWTVADETRPQRAAVLRSPALVEPLLEGGADVNGRGEAGWTPLHSAARAANTAVIDILLAAGAEVNARFAGGTPLHMATAGAAPPQAIEALLAAGAKVNARDEDGETPLREAVLRSDTAAVAELLLAAGADLDARDRTPRADSRNNAPLSWLATRH